MTLRPQLDQVEHWHVPPRCQGQTVEISYGSDRQGLYYRRIHDRSDRTTSYAVAEAYSCGCTAECDCFEPWNGMPTAFSWTPVVLTLSSWISHVGSRAAAIEAENTILGAGGENLPEVARRRLLGERPEPAYWLFLAEQWNEMSRDAAEQEATRG